VQVKTSQQLEGRLQHLEAATREQLERIRGKMDERLDTIGQNVQMKLDENMQEGFKHYEKVQEYLKSAEMQLQAVSAVGTSLNELNSLLKLPHLRGGFGEASLERLLQDFYRRICLNYKAQLMAPAAWMCWSNFRKPRCRLTANFHVNKCCICLRARIRKN
jgi:DNA anti-recombination protein RmuC